MLRIEEVIWKVLVSIYSNDLLNEKLYLKGGQALRFSEGIDLRLSKDADFSIEDVITEEDSFFEIMETSIYNEFLADDYYIFDFHPTRRPRIMDDGAPDFKKGWAVTFKIVTKDKMTKSIEEQRREAIIPLGAESSKIPIDISEKEYCGSIETVTVKSIEIKVYSRSLLVLEKMRAVCQSHPDYKHKNPKKSKSRARDFFDIEQLYSKSLKEGKQKDLIKEMQKHFRNVFDAKDVDLAILALVTSDKLFVERLSNAWKEVETTVSGKKQSFDYYLDTFQYLVDQLEIQ